MRMSKMTEYWLRWKFMLSVELTKGDKDRCINCVAT